MILSIDTLKKTIAKKGYKWFEDRPNIIMIRTNLDIPDVFNDFCACVHKENGVEVMKTWTVTTDPGLYWLQNPMNKLGTAVLCPGQYIDSHQIGLHQGKADHPALTQVGKVKVYRNPDRTGKRDSKKWVIDEGIFGINVHSTSKTTVSKQIGKWSAGCQVFPAWKDKEELLAICAKYKVVTKNRFTITLVNENDLVA